MSVQETQVQKVIVQVTRCVHFNGHENDQIRKISVQPPVVNEFLPDRVFQNVVGLRSHWRSKGGECISEFSSGCKGDHPWRSCVIASSKSEGEEEDSCLVHEVKQRNTWPMTHDTHTHRDVVWHIPACRKFTVQRHVVKQRNTWPMTHDTHKHRDVVWHMPSCRKFTEQRTACVVTYGDFFWNCFWIFF